METSKNSLAPIILILLSALGFISFIILSSTLPFKDTLFAQLYPKETSEAAEVVNIPETSVEFVSPKNYYRLTYDPRQWTNHSSGAWVTFDLNKEYGFARLDIAEGESAKDLDGLKNEIAEVASTTPVSVDQVQFKGRPSYSLTYKEDVLGEGVYYSQQIVKDGNKFFIFEKRAPSLDNSQAYLDNLLDGFSFGVPDTKPQVKGILKSEGELTTVQLVDLVRPSVASIVHIYCLEIINLKPTLSGLSKPKYNFCGMNKGSGFIVNEKGVIATNGHVAKIYPEEGLVTNLLYEGGKAFTSDLIRGVYLLKGEVPTKHKVDELYGSLSSSPQYLDIFLAEIFRLTKEQIVNINIKDEKYYINVGDEPVRIDHKKMNGSDYIGSIIPSSTTYQASVLAFDYPNRYSYDAIVNKVYQSGSDVALLQIDNAANNLFPALKLGDINEVREGSDVIVVGYPILVEGGENPDATISYNTSTRPTITRGIVSAIKQDASGRVVIQTDASIDHGNSGGPGFDSMGQVIGIATFFIESQSGNFNFLRSVTDLKELMSKNNVENKAGNVSVYWQEGLRKFRNKYYREAITDFNEVERLSSTHPTVKEFIKRSEDGVVKGESLEGFVGFIKSVKVLGTFGIVSIAGFLVGGFLMVRPLAQKKGWF